MVKSKTPRPPEGNELKIPTDRNKGQVYKPKKYIGKKPQNKPSPDPKTKTDFQGRCTDLEATLLTLDQEHLENFQKNEGTGAIPWNNIQ